MPAKQWDGTWPMSLDEVCRAIKKYGKHKCTEGKKMIYAVQCTVCGKEMLSSAPVEDRPYGASITKRGTAVFWHGRCEKNLWNSRIR